MFESEKVRRIAGVKIATGPRTHCYSPNAYLKSMSKISEGRYSENFSPVCKFLRSTIEAKITSGFPDPRPRVKWRDARVAGSCFNGLSLKVGPMRNWKDDIELAWTLRDIYAGRLKLSPITEDQLRELLEMGLVEVMNDQVKLTEAGYRKIH
ncbi:hypothetical protein AB7783_12145 [Tardiphaga sp. 172_B4_N1_3]|uniref:hypothetical protein n=1 Tax=Tardiphaga sp. 172_B4_N1_3 TaxID=3240787 RepID=UPI003F8C7F08